MGDAHKKLAESFATGSPCTSADLGGIGVLSTAGMPDLISEVPEALRSRVETLVTLADTFAPNRVQTIKEQLEKILADGSEPALTDQEAGVLNAYLVVAHGRAIDDEADLLGRENKDEDTDAAKKTVRSSTTSGPVIDIVLGGRSGDGGGSRQGGGTNDENGKGRRDKQKGEGDRGQRITIVQPARPPFMEAPPPDTSAASHPRWVKYLKPQIERLVATIKGGGTDAVEAKTELSDVITLLSGSTPLYPPAVRDLGMAHIRAEWHQL